VPPFLKAEAARHRARLALRADGSRDQVEKLLRSVTSTMEELGYPYWRALAELDLGRFLVSEGRADEAQKPLALAADTFELLRAGPALDQARSLLA
jgi:hypothetical protein